MKPETDLQQRVVKFYRDLGCEVVVLGGQPRKTYQTPGVPDLKIYCVRKRKTWWLEVKTKTGQQTKSQADFQLMAETCDEVCLVGGLEVVQAHLMGLGIIAAP